MFARIIHFAFVTFSVSPHENTKKYPAITPLIPAIIGINISNMRDIASSIDVTHQSDVKNTPRLFEPAVASSAFKSTI